MSDPGVRFQELLKSSSQAASAQQSALTFDWSLSASGTWVSGTVTITSTSSNQLTFAGLSLQSTDETIITEATVGDGSESVGVQVILVASSNAYDVEKHGTSLVAIAAGEVNGATYSAPAQHFTVQPG
jgi:putative lipoic acid-binding regulatory protein